MQKNNKDKYIAEILSLSAAQLEATINFVKCQESLCTRSLLGVLKQIDSAHQTSLPGGQDGEEAEGPTPVDTARDRAEALTAFQFVDSAIQRLSHVLFELRSIASFVASKDQDGSEEQWRRLVENIRAMYSTRQEQEIFDHVLGQGELRELLVDSSISSKAEESPTVECFRI